ncbi:hypothetical protein ADIS_3619 [Lunatimonas lonarensis]|uniref:Uncharacterized protein n=1 Tax=Lunatimonas lonarensis TaxID=1232681 RepID=R7ZPH4_9BACT|nr:hypothetical protein ADIS_3619 [Lunatimonas lonarensis]
MKFAHASFPIPQPRRGAMFIEKQNIPNPPPVLACGNAHRADQLSPKPGNT